MSDDRPASEAGEAKPSNPCQFDIIREQKPQEYYDAIKARFAQERDLRLSYRPEGTSQFTTELARRWRDARIKVSLG